MFHSKGPLDEEIELEYLQSGIDKELRLDLLA